MTLCLLQRVDPIFQGPVLSEALSELEVESKLLYSPYQRALSPIEAASHTLDSLKEWKGGFVKRTKRPSTYRLRLWC
jgi:hypothetical protein